jgi:hypothetical protein
VTRSFYTVLALLRSHAHSTSLSCASVPARGIRRRYHQLRTWRRLPVACIAASMSPHTFSCSVLR